MALTITKALPEVLLCGIPSYLGLTTTRTILTPGTLAVNVWTKTGGITNGSIFPVHWLGNKLTPEIFCGLMPFQHGMLEYHKVMGKYQELRSIILRSLRGVATTGASLFI
jgi:hypothetical protein